MILDDQEGKVLLPPTFENPRFDSNAICDREVAVADYFTLVLSLVFLAVWDGTLLPCWEDCRWTAGPEPELLQEQCLSSFSGAVAWSESSNPTLHRLQSGSFQPHAHYSPSVSLAQLSLLVFIYSSIYSAHRSVLTTHTLHLFEERHQSVHHRWPTLTATTTTTTNQCVCVCVCVSGVFPSPTKSPIRLCAVSILLLLLL